MNALTNLIMIYAAALAGIAVMRKIAPEDKLYPVWVVFICVLFTCHVNYGSCTAWARVLDDMGHEVETPVYEKDGFLRIPYLKVDGKKIIEFE